jgi:hypothetical protein
MKLALLTLTLFVPLLAQQTPDPVFFVAAGASYNGTATPKTAGWTSIAFEATPGLYSITTMDQTLTTRSLRTGLAKKIFARAGVTVLLHADAGVTTTTLGVTANAVGSFSGGPMVTWKIPKLKNVYALGVVRFVAVTSVTVKPLYEIGLGWGF